MKFQMLSKANKGVRFEEVAISVSGNNDEDRPWDLEADAMAEWMTRMLDEGRSIVFVSPARARMIVSRMVAMHGVPKS